jgi:glutathione S-transferase
MRLRVADIDHQEHRPDYARRAVSTTLYAIPASHPCAAVEAALRLKEVPYARVDLPPLVTRVALRRRFGHGTVPAVVFADGANAVGSRTILRVLEERTPEPRLFPPEDDDRRARVERAEEWGEEVLQPLVRRLIWAALDRAPAALPSYAAGARLPVPAIAARVTAPLVARASRRLHQAGDLDVRADLLHLDSHLRRVEGWMDDGTLGGEAPNAADLQIGASLRLLLTIGDVAARIDRRPAAALAQRWFPSFPGRVPEGALPHEWLHGVG